MCSRLMISGDGHSSWFHSVVVALLHSRLETLERCWTVTGEPGDKVSEAEFHLYTTEGEKTDFTMKFKDVFDGKGKADVYDIKKAWWIAGLQLAALQLEGYTGLRKDGFTWSEPDKAFKILTNEDTEIYNPRGANKEKELWALMTQSGNTPIVFSIKFEDGSFYWYAALSATVNEKREGEEDWEKGELEIYAGNRRQTEVHPFAKWADEIESVVHWKLD
ncbi:hypothetical protein I302_107689 [Kwoniella bestiolae CBS 10118]|uniref:Uncharacterized protein n=1 Tax=Kwoniella bestiolae CBS 10118 TaxID=1296100 RepID=A0A1B9FXU3_9TREE|nr:hypothetical protein I302_06572 [Kwoniella bestiolae CBS 10118]OCF23589.1 hypothetical protein I302_06572 [Kwoniella bestiolae CBS 10118]